MRRRTEREPEWARRRRLDREAEAAAREQNPTAYVTAFGKRNDLTPEMERIADKIGFEECSQNNTQ